MADQMTAAEQREEKLRGRLDTALYIMEEWKVRAEKAEAALAAMTQERDEARKEGRWSLVCTDCEETIPNSDEDGECVVHKERRIRQGEVDEARSKLISEAAALAASEARVKEAEGLLEQVRESAQGFIATYESSASEGGRYAVLVARCVLEVLAPDKSTAPQPSPAPGEEKPNAADSHNPVPAVADLSMSARHAFVGCGAPRLCFWCHHHHGVGKGQCGKSASDPVHQAEERHDFGGHQCHISGCGKPESDPVHETHRVRIGITRESGPEPETLTGSSAKWQTITADLSPEGRLAVLFDEIEAEVIAKHGPEEWDRRVAAALAVTSRGTPK